MKTPTNKSNCSGCIYEESCPKELVLIVQEHKFNCGVLNRDHQGQYHLHVFCEKTNTDWMIFGKKKENFNQEVLR
jgi:hypothetical protein